MESLNELIDWIQKQDAVMKVIFSIFILMVPGLLHKFYLFIIKNLKKAKDSDCNTSLTIIKDISTQLKLKDELRSLKDHFLYMIIQMPVTMKKLLYIILPGSLIHKYTGREMILTDTLIALPTGEDPLFIVGIKKISFKVGELTKVEIEIINNSKSARELYMGISKSTIKKWFQLKVNDKNIKLINAEFSDSIKGGFIKPQKVIIVNLEFQELSQYSIRNIYEIIVEVNLKFKGNGRTYSYKVEKSIDSYIEKNTQYLLDNDIEVNDFLCIFSIGGALIFPLILISILFVLDFKIHLIIKVLIVVMMLTTSMALNFKVLQIFGEFIKYLSSQHNHDK